MRNKKKKGFTLIELIAVIAILGVLGTILVPKITGYTDKAKNAKLQSSAKVIVNAIELYNAEASASNKITIDKTEGNTLSSLGTKLDSTLGGKTIPSELSSLTLGDIADVSNGTFTAIEEE